MKNVLFQTDEAVYKQFSLLSKLEDKKIGETITELMKEYVRQNEPKLSGLPAISASIPRQPALFEKPEDWHRFLLSLDPETFKKYDMRFWLLHDLMQIIVATNQTLVTDTPSYNPELFHKSDEFREIRSKYYGIVPYHKLQYPNNVHKYTTSHPTR